MKQIWNIAKYFITFASFVTVCFGAFKLVDSIRDDVSDIKDNMEYNSVEQGFISEDIMDIKDSLKRVEDHQKKQDEYMSDMESAARFYIHNQKTMTEEAMEEALKILLKKNGLDPTVYNESSYGNITETETDKSNLNP